MERKCKIWNYLGTKWRRFITSNSPCCLSRSSLKNIVLPPGLGNACPARGVKVWSSRIHALDLSASPVSCDCLDPWTQIQSLINMSLIWISQLCVSPAFLNPVRSSLNCNHIPSMCHDSLAGIRLKRYNSFLALFSIAVDYFVSLLYFVTCC